MPDAQTWPPPPDVPDPLTEHDEFLGACVRASTSKRLSRLSLIMDLRKETGLDLRQCGVVVNGFCDRNAILMPRRGTRTRLGCLLPLIQILALVAFEVSFFLLDRAHDAAPTRSARLAIRAERIDVDLMFIGIFLVATCFQMVLVSRHAKQARLDAEDAKRRMSS